MRANAILFLTSACFATIVCLASCSTSHGEGVTFNVVPGKQDAQILVDADNERAVIQIFSQSGIGSADIEVTSGTLPKRIVLQFHLRGLEELCFTYGDVVVTGSISSMPGNSIHQNLRDAGDSAGQERSISPDSPYWMKMSIISKGTSPNTIPLQDGYIEVEAPEDLIKGGQRKFSMRWIDFYR